MEALFLIMTWFIVVLAFMSLARLTGLMVGADLFTVQRHIRKQDSVYEPTITVVIPAHNEEQTILRSLSSVAASEYDRAKLTIVVVDDGSSDTTAHIVRSFQKDNPTIPIELISKENGGKAHALNSGIKKQLSELIMCLDADSALHPRALYNAAQHFTDSRVVALSANVHIIPRPRLLNVLQRIEYILCQRQKRAHAFFNIEYIVGGIGSTFRRSALQKVNFYDTDTMTEDIDLTMKLLRLGNKENRVAYGDDVVAYTESAHTLRDLMKQRFRWKFGRAQTFYKNADMFFSKSSKSSKFLTWMYLPYALLSDFLFFFEPLVVTFLLGSALFLSDWTAFVGAMIVLGFYTALSILSEDTLSGKERLQLAALSPFMYLLFYILSFVEYVALIRTYVQTHRIPESIAQNNCAWEHVERTPVMSRV